MLNTYKRFIWLKSSSGTLKYQGRPEVEVFNLKFLKPNMKNNESTSAEWLKHWHFIIKILERRG